MKRLFTLMLLLICVAAMALAQNNEKNFTLEVTGFDSKYNGYWVSLSDMNLSLVNNIEGEIARAEIKDGKVLIKGKVKEPLFCCLIVPSDKEGVYFLILEETKILF